MIRIGAIATFLGSLLMLCPACQKKAAVGKLIDSLGTYTLGPKKKLIVSASADGLLQYTINQGNRTLLKSIERPSLYQDWSLFFDTQGQLWAYNSDLGGVYVWVPHADTYDRHELNKDDPLLAQMPVE